MKIESMALSSALALLLLAAGGCKTDPTESGTTTTSGTTTAEMPAELRGVWLDHWSTSMGYELATETYDFETNVWFMGRQDFWDMAPYRGFGISFDQDGNFIWVLGSDGGLVGCQSYSIDFMKGTAVAQNGTIRFHAAERRQRYESTCDPSLNFDRDASGGDFEMEFVVGATQDTGLPTLRLVNPIDGTTFDYFEKN